MLTLWLATGFLASTSEAPPVVDARPVGGHFFEPHPNRRSRADIEAEERRKLRRAIERAFADPETPEAAALVEIAAPIAEPTASGLVRVDWDEIGNNLAALRKAVAAYIAAENDRRARLDEEEEDEAIMLLIAA